MTRTSTLLLSSLSAITYFGGLVQSANWAGRVNAHVGRGHLDDGGGRNSRDIQGLFNDVQRNSVASRWPVQSERKESCRTKGEERDEQGRGVKSL